MNLLYKCDYRFLQQQTLYTAAFVRGMLIDTPLILNTFTQSQLHPPYVQPYYRGVHMIVKVQPFLASGDCAAASRSSFHSHRVAVSCGSLSPNWRYLQILV